MKPECLYDMEQNDEEMKDPQVFAVTVYPTREPEEQGVLTLLDSHDMNTAITVAGNADFTLRLSQKPDGFKWNVPTDTEIEAFSCVTLPNKNLGDFLSGW
jgi:hypothetical protein